jgi:hypothetical protein
MDRPTQMINLQIKSTDLVNGRYFFPTRRSIAGVRVEAVYFPVSWHNVTAQNNRLRVTQLQGTTPLTVVVSIPVGNYNGAQLLAAIGSALTNVGGGFIGTWSFTLDSLTGRAVCQVSGIPAPGRQFRIERIGPDVKDLNTFLNFSYNELSFGNTLTASGVLNLHAINVVNVISRDLGGQLEDNLHSSMPLQNRCIASVMVERGYGVVQGSRLHRPVHDMFSQKGIRQELESFDLSLADDDFEDIDFLSAPWYVELSFV